MWEVTSTLHRDAFRKAQFVERLNGVQIWNLNDFYYILSDESFSYMWSEVSADIDRIRRETRNV